MMVLYIRKRTVQQVLALYIFITPFLLNFFQFFLHLPGFVKYTVDVAWVSAMLCLLVVRQQNIQKKILPLVIFVFIYFLYVLTVYLFHYQSVFYLLWGLRNNVRYYIAFIAFAVFLEEDDLEWCLKIVDILFVIHVVVTFFQFFVLGYKWDYLGGIFGVELGCNGHSMLLIGIICAKSLLMYMNDKELLWVCLLKCGASLIIAAMAELKFFFVVFFLIVFLATILTKFSPKKVLLIVMSGVMFSLAGSIFTAIWGEDAALNFDRIRELLTSTSYSTTRDLGRFTAIPVLSKTILTQIPQKLFGLGLGNCDTSSFAICNTPFFQAHSYLNYDWLSSAFSFLETGYIGLTIFLSFFAMVFILAYRINKKGKSQVLYCQLAMLMSCVCMVLVFYNASLRSDAGYIMYFVLALPFVASCGETDTA